MDKVVCVLPLPLVWLMGVAISNSPAHSGLELDDLDAEFGSKYLQRAFRPGLNRAFRRTAVSYAPVLRFQNRYALSGGQAATSRKKEHYRELRLLTTAT